MLNHFGTRKKNRITCAGFTVIELLAAMVLVLCGILGFTKIAFLALDQQRSARTREIASDQLQNILEQISPRDFDRENDPIPGESREMQVRNALPDGEVVLERIMLPNTQDAILLKATVSWSEGAHQPRRSLSGARIGPSESLLR